jgi:hypothetical protein
MESIEEMIADAQAEEQVKAEFKNSKNNIADNFKADLKAALKNALADVTEVDDQLVRITLGEYMSLVYMARDLDLLKTAIARSLGLSYNEEYLTIKHEDEILDVYKTLYREEYDALLSKEQEKGE